MLKMGKQIYHLEYGKGTVVSILDEKDRLLVCFDEEFEVLMGEIIYTDSYFEDNTRLQICRFIEVDQSEVNQFPLEIPIVTLVKKLISTATHCKCKECGWLICACGCNY